MALPPVIATLVADTKEYSAKMTEAQAQMDTLGKSADTAGGKFGAFASKASTAVIGLGLALGAYAVDQAYKFQEGLDAIKNQSGATDAQIKALGKSILNISNTTGVATSDLLKAGLAVYQAGIKGKAATDLLNAASKAQVITGTNVQDVTSTLISIEGLHFKSMGSIANLTGKLIAGSKDYVGGLSAEASVLQGKVGVALAHYGLSLNTAISLGAQFAKVGLPTRSVASFVNGLGKLEAPLTTIHTTTKGTYTTLSTYALALNQVGLSQNKLASYLRTGNIPGLLLQIKDAAGGSATKLSQLMNIVFGSSAGGVAQNLLNSVKTLNTVNTAVGAGGAGTLQSSFGTALKQIGPQLTLLKTRLENLMISAGQYLLPIASKVAPWATKFFDKLKNDTGFRSAFGVVAASLFAGALATKLAGVGVAIATAFGATVEAGVAGAIGAAIGVAVLAVLTGGSGSQIKTGVGQLVHPTKSGGWMSGLENVIGGLDNTMRTWTNRLLPGIGTLIQPNLMPTVGGHPGSRSHDPGGRAHKTLTVINRRKFSR